MRIHETWLGLIFMALAALFFGYTFTFPEFPGQKYGPALFPRVVAFGAFVCGALIAWRGRGTGLPFIAFSESFRQPRLLLSFLAMPLAIVLYLLLAERLGFLPTAALIVGSLGWWFGLRPLGAVALGVLSAVGVNWFFGTLMRVPLPRGWFMQMLSGG